MMEKFAVRLFIIGAMMVFIGIIGNLFHIGY